MLFFGRHRALAVAFSGHLRWCCWIGITVYFCEWKFDDLINDDGAISIANYEV